MENLKHYVDMNVNMSKCEHVTFTSTLPEFLTFGEKLARETTISYTKRNGRLREKQ